MLNVVGGDFEGAFDHILLAQSIDLFLIAPATADSIARLAAGIADDFLTTFHLAVTAPVVMAPAMNTRMWNHASVQSNHRPSWRRSRWLVSERAVELVDTPPAAGAVKSA